MKIVPANQGWCMTMMLRSRDCILYAPGWDPWDKHIDLQRSLIQEWREKWGKKAVGNGGMWERNAQYKNDKTNRALAHSEKEVRGGYDDITKPEIVVGEKNPREGMTHRSTPDRLLDNKGKKIIDRRCTLSTTLTIIPWLVTLPDRGVDFLLQKGSAVRGRASAFRRCGCQSPHRGPWAFRLVK